MGVGKGIEDPGGRSLSVGRAGVCSRDCRAWRPRGGEAAVRGDWTSPGVGMALGSGGGGGGHQTLLLALGACPDDGSEKTPWIFARAFSPQTCVGLPVACWYGVGLVAIACRYRAGRLKRLFWAGHGRRPGGLPGWLEQTPSRETIESLDRRGETHPPTTQTLQMPRHRVFQRHWIKVDHLPRISRHLTDPSE